MVRTSVRNGRQRQQTSKVHCSCVYTWIHLSTSTLETLPKFVRYLRYTYSCKHSIHDWWDGRVVHHVHIMYTGMAPTLVIYGISWALPHYTSRTVPYHHMNCVLVRNTLGIVNLRREECATYQLHYPHGSIILSFFKRDVMVLNSQSAGKTTVWSYACICWNHLTF